jgi:hypothetical protein
MSNYQNQRGFAIGTVLLAVVLIAAIVSAMAVASRGSISSGDAEKAKVASSMVIMQYTEMNTYFDRYNASYSSNTDADTSNLVQAGLLSSALYSNHQAINSPGSPLGTTGLINGQLDATAKTNGTRSLIIYGVSDLACRALNKRVYDRDRQIALEQNTFDPGDSTFGMHGAMSSSNGYSVMFDDGTRRWTPSGTQTSVIGIPDMSAMPSWIIPVFANEPVCVKWATAAVPAGSLNAVIAWRY